VPARLARRWLETAERQVPLLVEQPEVLSQRISIALPEGKHLRGAPKPVSLSTPFGAYQWSAREESGKLVIEESLSMPQQRVLPAQYPGFVEFSRAVDQAQSQDLVVAS
jgi:hypothetical protein